MIRGALTGDGPMDTAVSRAILQRVTAGELPETLQVGTPHRVVAFGKHDTLTEGFGDAVAAAETAGFDPTVRIAGGRAVVFSPTIVRFAWTLAVSDPAASMHDRFQELADAVVRTLAAFDVAGTVGEIPDEYCAGAYSVHILGGRKVMGVGQRLSRSAAQVGGMIVVSGADAINEVLVPVYAALGVPMDPGATGSIADDRVVDVGDLQDAFVAEIAAGRRTTDTSVDDVTMEMASLLRADHDPRERTT